MSAAIKIFQVGENLFTHVRDAYHDSVELRDEDNETLLTYGADASVTSQDGLMGNFYVEFLDGQPRWVYYEMPLQTRHVFGPDLYSAEVEVSKRFIGSFGAVVAEPFPALSPALSPAMSAL